MKKKSKKITCKKQHQYKPVIEQSQQNPVIEQRHQREINI